MPYTSLSYVHSTEMILPAHISESVQRAAEGGSMGGGNHFHFSPTIRAFDARGVSDALEEHGHLFFKAAMEQMRRRG